MRLFAWEFVCPSLLEDSTDKLRPVANGDGHIAVDDEVKLVGVRPPLSYTTDPELQIGRGPSAALDLATGPPAVLWGWGQRHARSFK